MKPTLFNFNGSALRVINNTAEIWFVAADVLKVLELDRKAMERLDADEKGVSSIHTLGGEQSVNIINESGLYSLTLNSRKPQAKAFKKWVTGTVLPSIRQSGSYTTPSTDSDHAAWLIRQMLKMMPADKMVKLILPLHAYGSTAKNGKQRRGFRRPAFITQKHRPNEAREIHERGIVLKYLAQNLLGEGGGV